MKNFRFLTLVISASLILAPAAGTVQAKARDELSWPKARLLQSGVPPSPRPHWTAESNQKDSDFGYSVASAGDVNGDGFDDVIVGDTELYNGLAALGRAYVFHGSAAGISRVANWTAEGSQEESQAGWSVASAGDVNGDGYDEVIVGAPYFDAAYEGAELEGRADLYYGSASGLSSTAGWSVVGDREYGLLGSGVGTAGDVNGDGYGDVIVGAASYSDSETYEGAAFVYLGSATGLGAVAAWRADGPGPYASFGWAVGTAGDVNADGYEDVIVGAGSLSHGQYSEGGAYVYHGSAAGLSTTASWSVEGNRAFGYFGSSVGTAGDVNGDGYADVIAGAAGNVVRAYAYYGSAAGLSPVADWIHRSDQFLSGFGFSVSTAGDVNGDGYDEVIVGAPYWIDGQDQEGGVWVFDGSASGLSTDFTWAAESNQASAWFGWSVSGAGDVNGDGHDDLIIGAPQYGHHQISEGIAVAYYGKP